MPTWFHPRSPCARSVFVCLELSLPNDSSLILVMRPASISILIFVWIDGSLPYSWKCRNIDHFCTIHRLQSYFARHPEISDWFETHCDSDDHPPVEISAQSLRCVCIIDGGRSRIIGGCRDFVCRWGRSIKHNLDNHRNHFVEFRKSYFFQDNFPGWQAMFDAIFEEEEYIYPVMFLSRETTQSFHLLSCVSYLCQNLSDFQ